MNSSQVINEHRQYIDQLRAQLAERDAKLKAIKAIAVRWVDGKEGSDLDFGGAMTEVIRIITETEKPNA